MESYFVNQFTENNINSVSSMELISPLKTYTQEDLNLIFSQQGIDAILSIILIDYYTEQAYIPQSSTTTGNATVYGNTIYGNSRTTTSGGFSVSKPRVKFEINLYDQKSGAIAWRATTLTKGGSATITDTMF